MKKPSKKSSLSPKQKPSDDQPLLEEVFDLDLLLKAEHEHDVKAQAKAVKKWDDSIAYPDLSDQVRPRFVTTGQALSRQLSPESRDSLFPGSILDELHAESRNTLNEHELRQRENLRMRARLDASFRRIFAFLDELTRQLNILQPAIPRVYQLYEHEFKDLVWQKGRVDYQSTSLYDATAGLESVTLTYRLASKGSPFCLERESCFVDSMYQRLFDHGLSLEVEKIHNARGVMQRARFRIQPEIRTQVRWRGNPEDGRMRCETHNLERFGRLTWLLPAEAPMNMSFLDEFGRLVLGREHDFPFILNRTQHGANG
ncbi:MAG: hypothetical protein FWH15_09140 [Betaproteobacteria bacterium]|nr:hypothetical protein [Betaproteobacteria bacterium]